LKLHPSTPGLATDRTLKVALWLRTFLISLLLIGCSGCSYFFTPMNTPLGHNPDGNSYGFNKTRGGWLGEDLVLLTFSGGGTRAAALSYGVLKELRDTTIMSGGQRVRLLDEVDSISSVSGGSFTAAYYGVFGDRIFQDFEDVFLKKSIQGILIQKLFDPSYWWRSLSSGFDRTEMAIEYYDGNIFEGKTFRDIDLSKRPFIEINATNLGAGTRFSFIQLYFDLICTDLLDFKIARAVTASSAVPIMFAPVVLKSYSGECSVDQNPVFKGMMSVKDPDPRLKELQLRIRRYMDHESHPYIHLIDGGVADNLGARAMTERLEAFQNNFTILIGDRRPKNIIMITVDAEVEPVHSVDESSDKPSLGDTLEAFSNIQFQLFNNETRILLDKKLDELKKHIEDEGHPVNLYKVPVEFASVHGKSLKEHLNSLPTSLELSSTDVDLLERTGAELVRNNKEFKAFLKTVEGYRNGDPIPASPSAALPKDVPVKHHQTIHHATPPPP
jgi:NTE family protein